MSDYIDIGIDIEEYDDFTGSDEWHAIYTIQLGQLIESGVFKWSEIDWQDSAYNAAQYERICTYFEKRFYYREISIIPIKEWFNFVSYKINYEIMPKLKPLYERAEQGINPFQNEDTYHKSRDIFSEYPQTLLSENADYITDGRDFEEETLKEGNLTESLNNYMLLYKGVDELMLDMLDSMFISLYSVNINGL